MPEWRKFKFKIVGKRNGEEIKPLTLPMSRLAAYLSDLAAVLGYKEQVHLMGIEDGSAQPAVWIDTAYVEAAIKNSAAAKSGAGPKSNIEAYQRLNNRLREDDGNADFIDEQTSAVVIEFPGKKSLTAAIGPIRENASVSGELRGIAGIDESIHLTVIRADGTRIPIETDEAFAKRLEKEGRLFTHIRLHGIAIWSRDENGRWHLDKFKAQSYDTEPLIDEPIGTTLDRLKNLKNTWKDLEDPLAELDRLRHGDDEPIQ